MTKYELLYQSYQSKKQYPFLTSPKEAYASSLHYMLSSLNIFSAFFLDAKEQRLNAGKSNFIYLGDYKNPSTYAYN